jgi:hypothetical protein
MQAASVLQWSKERVFFMGASLGMVGLQVNSQVASTDRPNG